MKKLLESSAKPCRQKHVRTIPPTPLVISTALLHLDDAHPLLHALLVPHDAPLLSRPTGALPKFDLAVAPHITSLTCVTCFLISFSHM